MGASQQGQTGQMNLTPENQGLFEALAKVMQRQSSTETSAATTSSSNTLPGGLPAPPVPKGLPNPAGGGKSGGGK